MPIHRGITFPLYKEDCKERQGNPDGGNGLSKGGEFHVPFLHHVTIIPGYGVAVNRSFVKKV